MVKRTITFSLDSHSIGEAIKQVEQFKQNLITAMGELVRTLTERGKEFAQLEILRMGAFDTGELADTMMGLYDDSSHIGIIRTGAYYAVFVEYGTGVVGAGNPYTGTLPPGPITVKGKTYTGYDTNHHGEKGWTYFSDRDGRWHRTRGQPSNPFMYNTYKELMRTAWSVAEEVFSKTL